MAVLPLLASDISAFTVYYYGSSQQIGPLSGAIGYKVQLTPKNQGYFSTFFLHMDMRLRYFTLREEHTDCG